MRKGISITLGILAAGAWLLAPRSGPSLFGPSLFGPRPALADAGPGSSLAGKVLWDGAVPERRKLAVDKDNDKCECDAKGGARQPFKLDEALVVDAGTRGVANCVVWLKGAPKGPGMNPVQIDQRGCVFSPHVALVAAGQGVKVMNPDKIAHNFHIFPKEKENRLAVENVSIAKFKPSIDVGPFPKPEFVRVACDIHLWMGGWVAVMENGWCARTDEKGAFTIPGVPPGKYTVALWHEPLASDGAPFLQEMQVTVEAGKEASAEFKLAAPK